MMITLSSDFKMNKFQYLQVTTILIANATSQLHVLRLNGHPFPVDTAEVGGFLVCIYVLWREL